MRGAPNLNLGAKQSKSTYFLGLQYSPDLSLHVSQSGGDDGVSHRTVMEIW